MHCLNYDTIDTPIGSISVYAEDYRLCLLDFTQSVARIERLLKRRYGEFALEFKSGLLDLKPRIDAYFVGDKHAFNGLHYDMHGTEFQRRVWSALLDIPYAKTCSYADLAKNVNKPSAVRAVANANAQNPLSIIVPCHRVIASDGSLAGYAGGVERKAWLLRHESESA